MAHDVIQLKRGRKSIWELKNPVLRPGEIGVVFDDDTHLPIEVFVGNGIHSYQELPKIGDDTKKFEGYFTKQEVIDLVTNAISGNDLDDTLNFQEQIKATRETEDGGIEEVEVSTTLIQDIESLEEQTDFYTIPSVKAVTSYVVKLLTNLRDSTERALNDLGDRISDEERDRIREDNKLSEKILTDVGIERERAQGAEKDLSNRTTTLEETSGDHATRISDLEEDLDSEKDEARRNEGLLQSQIGNIESLSVTNRANVEADKYTNLVSAANELQGQIGDFTRLEETLSGIKNVTEGKYIPSNATYSFDQDAEGSLSSMRGDNINTTLNDNWIFKVNSPSGAGSTFGVFSSLNNINSNGSKFVGGNVKYKDDVYSLISKIRFDKISGIAFDLNPQDQQSSLKVKISVSDTTDFTSFKNILDETKVSALGASSKAWKTLSPTLKTDQEYSGYIKIDIYGTASTNKYFGLDNIKIQYSRYEEAKPGDYHEIDVVKLLNRVHTAQLEDLEDITELQEDMETKADLSDTVTLSKLKQTDLSNKSLPQTTLVKKIEIQRSTSTGKNIDILFKSQDVANPASISEFSLVDALKDRDIIERLGYETAESHNEDHAGTLESIQKIKDLIPSTANPGNLLVTASDLTELVSTVSSRLLNASPLGAQFASHTDLINGPWYVGSKEVKSAGLKTRDYAIVANDETKEGKCTKYVYVQLDGTDQGVWSYEGVYATTFSQAQNNSINSGITSEDVAHLRELYGTDLESGTVDTLGQDLTDLEENINDRLDGIDASVADLNSRLIIVEGNITGLRTIIDGLDTISLENPLLRFSSSQEARIGNGKKLTLGASSTGNILDNTSKKENYAIDSAEYQLYNTITRVALIFDPKGKLELKDRDNTTVISYSNSVDDEITNTYHNNLEFKDKIQKIIYNIPEDGVFEIKDILKVQKNKVEIESGQFKSDAMDVKFNAQSSRFHLGGTGGIAELYASDGVKLYSYSSDLCGNYIKVGHQDSIASINFESFDPTDYYDGTNYAYPRGQINFNAADSIKFTAGDSRFGDTYATSYHYGLPAIELDAGNDLIKIGGRGRRRISGDGEGAEWNYVVRYLTLQNIGIIDTDQVITVDFRKIGTFYVPNSFYNTNGLVSTTADQTIDGVKTFSAFPILPATTPGSDNQAVNKKYVDDIKRSILGADLSESFDTLKEFQTWIEGHGTEVSAIQGSISRLEAQIQEVESTVGPKGEDGVTFTPTVTAAGDLSWTSSDPSVSSPATVNIKGPKGDKGDPGQKGQDGAVGPSGPQGERGLQGETGPQGEQGPAGLKGDKGDKGDTGEQGPAGESAFDIWKRVHGEEWKAANGGKEPTESDFLDWLKADVVYMSEADINKLFTE